MQNLLFVYGTLRPGYKHPMREWLSQNADWLGQGRFQGRMFLVSWYPSVVPSDAPDDWVLGDVLRLKMPTEAFRLLDDYEGAEYVRALKPVHLTPSQKTETAWIYLWNRPTDNLEPIPSGDFFRRAH